MDEFTPSRRRLLAGVLAGGIGAAAGCLGTGGDDGPDGAELRLSLSRVDGPLRDRYVRDRDEPEGRWDEAALDAALAGEPYTTQRRTPFFATPDDPAYVAHDGSYYRLGSVVVDESAETYPVFRLFAADDEDVGSPVDGGEDGSLPEVDRRAVERAHLAARARGNAGGYPAGLVDRGGYAYRTETARADSALLDDGPDHVTYRDTTYRVDIERERFHEAVYRPTAEAVAETPERMEAILTATFVGPRIDPDGLSAEAGRIVEDAEADEYSETHSYSDAYVELLYALDARPYVDGNVRKDAQVRENRADMIRYGDAFYESSLRVVAGADG